MNTTAPYAATSTATLEMLHDQYQDIVCDTDDETTHEAFAQISAELKARA